MPHLAVIVHGINSLCVTRREVNPEKVPFPPDCQTYRGGGFDNRLKGFWTVGKQYRVPGFLATSFSEAVADKFIGPSSLLDSVTRLQRILAPKSPAIQASLP